MDKPLKSVTHGQCDARPAVTFPAAGHHCPLTGTKVYCLVTEARVCEQLAQGCYLKARGRESNPRPSESQVQRSNHHQATHTRTVKGRKMRRSCWGGIRGNASQCHVNESFKSKPTRDYEIKYVNGILLCPAFLLTLFLLPLSRVSLTV